MVYCAERIPKLKSRTQKDTKAQGDTPSGSAQGGQKKKGKKKQFGSENPCIECWESWCLFFIFDVAMILKGSWMFLV